MTKQVITQKSVLDYLIVLIIIFIVVFTLGIFVFHHYFHQDWANSIYHTATFGLKADSIIINDRQKLFISFYIIFAGLIFVAIASNLLGHIVNIYGY